MPRRRTCGRSYLHRAESAREKLVKVLQSLGEGPREGRRSARRIRWRRSC